MSTRGPAPPVTGPAQAPPPPLKFRPRPVPPGSYHRARPSLHATSRHACRSRPFQPRWEAPMNRPVDDQPPRRGARLDAFARTLGTARSRREVIVAVAGSIGGVLLTAAGSGPVKAWPWRRFRPCARPFRRCGSKCVLTDTDPDHCGECFEVCPFGHGCSSGICCPVDLFNCGNVCISLFFDPTNCGGCGYVCPRDMYCDRGVCECGDAYTDCHSECVDTRSDPLNCGECGNRCGPGWACEEGLCLCPPGMGRCGAACVDQAHDAAHCGPRCEFCGTSLCCDGVCTRHDENNCGSCGRKCPKTKPMCMGANQCCPKTTSPTEMCE
jgi:hypothetical protein